MITAEFFRDGTSNKMLGFSVSGHAEFDEIGLDIVCASVTSATILTMNNITEFLKLDAVAEQLENELLLKLKNDPDGVGNKLLWGLNVHMGIIAQEFPGTLKVVLTDR